MLLFWYKKVKNRKLNLNINKRFKIIWICNRIQNVFMSAHQKLWFLSRWVSWYFNRDKSTIKRSKIWYYWCHLLQLTGFGPIFTFHAWSNIFGIQKWNNVFYTLFRNFLAHINVYPNDNNKNSEIKNHTSSQNPLSRTLVSNILPWFFLDSNAFFENPPGMGQMDRLWIWTPGLVSREVSKQ